MTERTVHTTTLLRSILDEVRIAPSGVALAGWDVEIRVVIGGWLIRATFERPDRETGEMGRGHGRWEMIETGATESAVVKTTWLLYDLLVRHEAMESFTYQGVRIFDPHRTVAELQMPAKASAA